MGMGTGSGFRELDLTDEQKAQVTSIVDSHQAEFKAVGEKMHAAREGMQALLEADTLDEAAVRAKSVEVAAAEADAAILGAKVRTQTVQVLTSEQLAKLKELQASRNGKQRRPGRHYRIRWRQPLRWGCLSAYFAGPHRHSRLAASSGTP